MLLHAGPRQAQPCQASWLGKIVYSVASGAVATVAGAGVSLAVAPAARVVTWCGVTCVVSVLAGVAWGSGPFTSYWKFCCRWLHGLVAS